MRALNLRRAERAVAGGEPGPEGNVTKLLSAEHAQRIADTALSLLGPAVALSEGPGAGSEPAWSSPAVCPSRVGRRKSRGIRSRERILGMPRDPLIV